MKTKRLFLAFTALFAIALGSNAKVIYVSYNGSNSNDGTSWTQAYLTPDTARVRAVAGDQIWVQGDVDGMEGYNIYTFTSSTAGAGNEAFKTGDVNWYGGFNGNESALSQRQLIDRDANGIVEPWEFKYPTKITFNLSNNALALSTGATERRVIDGFTFFPGEYRLTTTFGDSKLFVVGPNVVLKNSTFQNANYIVTESTGNTTLRPFMWMRGQMDYCLWENITVQVGLLTTRTQYGLLFDMDWQRAATNIPTTVTNCVFRNNTGVIDGSQLTATSMEARGVLMFINNSNGNLAGTHPDVFANNLIYNNDIRFIPSATLPTINAGILGTSWGNGGAAGSPATSTVMNNVFANNKLTNIKTPGIYLAASGNTIFPTIVNNVFYNNKKYTGSVLQDPTLQPNIEGGNITLANVFNNYTTDKAIWWGATTEDNVAAGNGVIAPSDPKFLSPTTAVGYSELPEVPKANWSLQNGSSLIGKGTAASYNTMVANAYNLFSKDFAGRPYASPRSVGAFEEGSVTTVVVSGLRKETFRTANFVMSTASGIQLTESGNLQVISLIGHVVVSMQVEAGDQINLKNGIYVLRLQTTNDNLVQKIML